MNIDGKCTGEALLKRKLTKETLEYCRKNGLACNTCGKPLPDPVIPMVRLCPDCVGNG